MEVESHGRGFIAQVYKTLKADSPIIIKEFVLHFHSHLKIDNSQ